MYVEMALLPSKKRHSAPFSAPFLPIFLGFFSGIARQRAKLAEM
jgi:hypothetical protein